MLELQNYAFTDLIIFSCLCQTFGFLTLLRIKIVNNAFLTITSRFNVSTCRKSVEREGFIDR